MTDTSTSRIVLFAEAPPADELRHILEQAGYPVACHPLDANRLDLGSARLLLLDGSSRALQLCRQLRVRLADQFVPILYILDDAAPAVRLSSLEAGADTYLPRPFAPGELLAQVRAFLRLKEMHDRLADKTAEVRRVNQRLQQTYQRIDAELELARRIQRSFLPQHLPHVPPVRFAVHYRPCDRVGGDFYDVFRLDEEHVGFYVADAMGHGMPASLLTIFIKKGVRVKEIFGSQYRLVPPEEVLRLLNRDMIDQALSETPFITMVYGLLHLRTGVLRFARAGHPHPVHVPREGPPVEWQVPGSLLGVFDTQFPVCTRTVQAGDKVLLYTDGLLAPAEDAAPPSSERVLSAAAKYRALPLQEFLTALTHEFEPETGSKDDVTLLCLEMDQ